MLPAGTIGRRLMIRLRSYAQLARLMPDRQIARLLNRSGKSTGYGNGWTEQRVRGFRNHHDIAVYRDGEWAERGEITLDAAAQIIGVAKMTALRMIRSRRSQGAPSLQGCALGHQGGGCGRIWIPQPINGAGNTKSGAADP